MGFNHVQPWFNHRYVPIFSSSFWVEIPGGSTTGEDLMSRRAYGVSVSLDPALRVLIRPEGIGNLQVFSEGDGRPETTTVGVSG